MTGESGEKKGVLEALRKIPGFDGTRGEDFTLERQGGMTNLVYKLDFGDRRCILRIPGKGTEDYIDRAVELHNARVAAAAGVSAEVVHGDAASGVMMTRFIDGIVTMSPEAFRARAGAPARAALALKRMHDCGREFRFRFELFAMIDDYLSILDKAKAELPEGYHAVVEAAQPLRATLDATPMPLAPCHCDPLCENFLDDGERMWIVDWEYSGMNDPIWDLGDLSVEAGFDADQDREMMAAYCGGPPSAALMGRMVVYKALCDLLWTLWGLIQHANGNPVEDFWAYALGRFERCQKLMQDPAFAGHVAAVRAN
ncbi:MAG: choline/ethanolamine kinase family protein [Kiloniellaceae bacterium]